LDPDLIGKSKNRTDSPAWNDVKDSTAARAKFLANGTEAGCVLGGTAWTVANDDLVEPGGLDLLVVDEAGQFSLAATIGASVCARLRDLSSPRTSSSWRPTTRRSRASAASSTTQGSSGSRSAPSTSCRASRRRSRSCR